MAALSVLCDENIDRQVIAHLEKAGHTGTHVVDVFDPGVDDEQIAAHARDRDLLVLTKDTDFLSMDREDHAGVLFLVDHRLSAYEIATIVLEVAGSHALEELRGVTYLTSAWIE